MTDSDLVYKKPDTTWTSALLLERQEWGLRCLDLVNAPRRFWADTQPPGPAVELGIDANRVESFPLPTGLLRDLPLGDSWPALSRRSIARLHAYFLLCEDPQRRMDAREVDTLAHQVSLVRHVLESDRLRRLLVADEVGLGKTVEVGLIIKELLDQNPGLKVVYFAPARLVSNVRREFERLDLHFRQWTAADADARLTDPRIIASIHRAVHGNNFERVIETGPWDLIIVDECHHLSAWSPGGGDPGEAYRLVRELIARQTPEGRAVLLSGTPHQGHVTRFENLLTLLRRPEESPESLTGRVIYRTKDDIRDWRRNLLFPPRQVNEPVVIDLGARYRAWIDHIHDFYKPPRESGKGAEARYRAAGWRCAQAIQWAASSPHAGLGFLVRQAIRQGMDTSNRTLEIAISTLRPYRSGTADEPVEALFQRLVKEVGRQIESADIDDIEDEDAADDATYLRGLDDLLSEGIEIVRDSGDEKWQLVDERILRAAGKEKVVLFAQPIETVISLASYLERTAGVRPALIIGGQSDAERQDQVNLFWRPDGPQFLVSSRAGGEGINLQVACRLIHIMPWNPMDLEQRVGRVHRFGSRKTIIVDTVVVRDSREADAYRIARHKLHVIAATLVERDRFESVFARVMCLVSPEELQGVLINAPRGPFSGEDQDEIARMVQQGYKTWVDFHARFGQEQQRIRQQNPGLVQWDDVARFATQYTNARVESGFTTQSFRTGDSAAEKATVFTFESGEHYSCGDYTGVPVFGPNGEMAGRLGLNIKPIARALRRAAFPESAAGAAHLRWKSSRILPSRLELPFGVLVFLRQTVRTDSASGWVEQSTALHCFTVGDAGRPMLVEGEDKGLLLRGLLDAMVRNKPGQRDPLVLSLTECEGRLAQDLRRPTSDELRAGIRHAVTPLFVGVVEEQE